MEHAAEAQGGQTVGGSSSSRQLGPSGRSTEMISNGRTDANSKVLVESVGENLLPTAQTWGLWRPGLPVAAPGTGNRHIDLSCYLWPGQALVTKLHYQLRGSGMSGRTAATQSDAGALELLAHRAPMHVQLSSDLAKGPALGIQVGCTLNVHRDTVTVTPIVWDLQSQAAGGPSNPCGAAIAERVAGDFVEADYALASETGDPGPDAA
jgi:hypothetical protein